MQHNSSAHSFFSLFVQPNHTLLACEIWQQEPRLRSNSIQIYQMVQFFIVIKTFNPLQTVTQREHGDP